MDFEKEAEELAKKIMGDPNFGRQAEQLRREQNAPLRRIEQRMRPLEPNRHILIEPTVCSVCKNKPPRRKLPPVNWTRLAQLIGFLAAAVLVRLLISKA